tara:strand:+ start:283 stop:1455 length:1173 start_codon:yes stop_codon:yes gene_type:complete
MIILLLLIGFLFCLYFIANKLFNKYNSNDSESIFKKRWRKFKSIKRGYYSFIIIIFLYVLSWFNLLLINNKPIIVKYDGHYYFPALKAPPAIGPFSPDWKDPYTWETFGFVDRGKSEPNYRELEEIFTKENNGNWMLMPIYPYSPYESLLSELEGTPPTAPSFKNILGTDANGGRDVFARMAYAFNYTLSFALVVTIISYILGIAVGALLGYLGGRFDIIGQRFIEIFSTIPYLYTIIIIRESFDDPPGLMGLAFILVAFSWMGMTYYIRGEFYREKAKDYVSAAISLGSSTKRVIIKHILPNALTPIITFAPFAIMGNIGALTSLDFLGFGLEPPAPSWGEMANQGIAEFRWWLILAPMLSSFSTLLLITFIGESIREAFDPRGHSRLR